MNRSSKKLSQGKKISEKSTIMNSTFRFKDLTNQQTIKFNASLFADKTTKNNKKRRRDKSGQSTKGTLSSKPSLAFLKSPQNNLKENGGRTTFISKNSSPTSTPLQFQHTLQMAERRLNKNDYKYVYQIGSGGFGSVWKVRNKQTNEYLAMKEISKAKVIMKKSVNSVINQKQLLDDLRNPFIINTRDAFQDRQYLYLLMEYLRGGDLRYHLCYKDYFNEQETKFIIACIVLGLEYIHSEEIIHRDLKPENLVFEENGYLRLTDFGVARKKKNNNSEQTSGTPGYMAPQVICRMNHSYQADFFALGVIAYEMVMGVRPYTGDSRKEIRDKILAHQARLSQADLPTNWSKDCLDFINRLIKRSYHGIQEIKSHPWLKNVNWKALARKECEPPFKPGILSESPQYQKQMENTQQTIIDEETVMLLRTSQIQQLFKGYDQPDRSRPEKYFSFRRSNPKS